MKHNFIPWLIAGLILETVALLLPAPMLSLLNGAFMPYGQAMYNVLVMLLGIGLVLAVLTALAHRPRLGRNASQSTDL